MTACVDHSGAMFRLDEGHGAQALGRHEGRGVAGAGHREEVRVGCVVAGGHQQRGDSEGEQEGG
jgi:hypothetical protein